MTSTENGGTFVNGGIYKNDSYEKNIVHVGYTPKNIENLPRNGIENNICEQNMESVYTNLSVPKKRKLSQDSSLVKSEPGMLPLTFECLYFGSIFLSSHIKDS